MPHLRTRDVAFERFAGMNQDGLGIWASPDGARIAWFKDSAETCCCLWNSRPDRLTSQLTVARPALVQAIMPPRVLATRSYPARLRNEAAMLPR